MKLYDVITSNIQYDYSNPLGLSTVPLLPEYAYIQNLEYESYDGTFLTFDLVLPKGTGKIPLVIFYHGGGFFQGDKELGLEGQYLRIIKRLLKANIGYASVNYRTLVPPNHLIGIKRPLFDCMAALQNIRFYHDKIRINKSEIALMGGSAGATASLWIGFNDNMKVSSPTFRSESTRVKAIVAKETQASLHMQVWANQVFNDIPFSLSCIKDIIKPIKVKAYYGNLPFPVSTMISTYISNNQNYAGTGNIALDLLSMMSPGDPPFWLESDKEEEEFPNQACVPTNSEQLVHHPYHPKALRDQAVSLNSAGAVPKIKYVARLSQLGIFEQAGLPSYAGKTEVDFLIDRLI